MQGKKWQVETWQSDVENWIKAGWRKEPEAAQNVSVFFEKGFEYTQRPERAWFGVHDSTISLVVGGIFLVAIVKPRPNRGIWMLLDDKLPIDGIEYEAAKSTQESPSPLVWAHSTSLTIIPLLIEHNQAWESYASASERIFDSPRISGDRDNVQIGRGKRRLSEFWKSASLFPDEVENSKPLYEGAACTVKVNAYERNPIARAQCIAHYGFRCSVCKLKLQDIYGEVGKDFIHVHHLKPIAEADCEYEIDPIKDLCPVCPNCHAIIHRRKPPYSIEEVQSFLKK